jgi:hypothetical protein
VERRHSFKPCCRKSDGGVPVLGAKPFCYWDSQVGSWRSGSPLRVVCFEESELL